MAKITIRLTSPAARARYRLRSIRETVEVDEDSVIVQMYLKSGIAQIVSAKAKAARGPKKETAARKRKAETATK